MLASRSLRTCVVGVAALSLALGAGVVFAQPAPPGSAPASPVAASANGVRYLAEFGPINSAEAVRAAYAKAKIDMAATGGLLIVPPGAAALYTEENTTQISPRTPAPPAETKNWKKAGPGITVIELEPDGLNIKGPSVSGVNIDRTLRMPLGESLPHWTTDYALNISNKLVHGSNSYLDYLTDPVEKGLDAKFYVRTIRGLYVGQFLNAHGGPHYGGGVTRVCIKSLGFDASKGKHFFTADTSINHVPNAIVQNKNNEGLIHMRQDTHCDEQTYDVMLNRYQYALGDTYMYFARFRYMSNIHSAAGDENGNVFACYTENLTNGFTARVESVDWTTNTLKFTGGNNADTLGTSRTILNLNPAKAINKGKIIIVPAESYWDTIDTGKFPFEGKTYPSTVVKGVGLRMGGLMRGDKDCPWDESIVGRWIGITEPTELARGDDTHGKTPTKIRWYEIDGFKRNPDGTKDITIQRFWWGAKTMQSPTLYRDDNYTWDGHIRPLSYTIVPGAYAAEVSRAVPGKGVKIENVLGMAPYKDMNTPFDFAKGDPIEQAVGPDPFKPTPLRIWMEDGLPSAFPAPAIDLANESRGGHVTQRYAAVWIRGGHAKLEDTIKAADGKPGWDNGLIFDSAMNNGLNFVGDMANAGILFQQPNLEQPIKWYYGTRETGKPFTAATLTVGKETGDLTFKGGDTRFSGSVIAKGLSGDDKPAKNLRGKNVPVKAGATSIDIVLPTAEADGDYAVFIEQTWFGSRAVTTQTEKGFTVSFEKPVPANAKISWLIVR
jgi:hypothetical protein